MQKGLLLVIIIILFKAGNLFAQEVTPQANLPFNDNLYLRYDSYLYSKNTDFHTDIKPYLQSQVDSVVKDSQVFDIYTRPYPQKNIINKIVNGLLYNHLVLIKGDNLYVTIDPSINFSVGQDFNENLSMYNNTRGAVINGSIGSKFSFYASIQLTNAIYPGYITQFIRDTLIVPGGAMAQAVKGSTNVADFSPLSGYISYSPNKYFNFQFGQDKNFIGDGYRSLILSDNAGNYPFFKITTTIWHIKFEDLYAQMINMQRDSNILGIGFNKKWMAMHYLSWDATRSLHFGFYDAVIWDNYDSLGQYRGFDITYLNPVIFLHTAQYNQGSPDNSVLGLTSSFKPINGLVLYGQLLIDDYSFAKSKVAPGFYGDKYGFQIGAKYYNAFGLKGLYLQSELNQVRPYTYSHTVPEINYANENQSLADPLGANFREINNFIGYTYKRLSVLFQYNFSEVGGDAPGTDYGSNIFLSDYNIPGYPDAYSESTLQGILNTIKYYQFTFDYLINPHNNLCIELSIAGRTSNSSLQNYAANWFMFGLKTNLYNSYFDF